MAITNGYATLNQVKAALRIPTADATDDSLLEMAVESASRLIDGYASRSFYAGGSATRYFSTDDPNVVQIDDCRTITEVATSSNADGVYDTVWTLGTAGSGDVQPEPINDFHGGLPWPYTRLRAIGDKSWPAYPETTVKVTASWGWPNIPTAITQATVIQGSRLYTRLQSPLGVAGWGETGIVRVSRGLDSDVAQLVEPYRRMVGLA